MVSALRVTPSLAAPPASCFVLTTGEVEQVVGKLNSAPRVDHDGGIGRCVYTFANGKDAFEVLIFPADGIDRGRKVSKKPIPVKGLGEDAFMDRGMHDLDYVNLFVKKEGTTVKLSLKETAGNEDKVKALAKKPVGRF